MPPSQQCFSCGKNKHNKLKEDLSISEDGGGVSNFVIACVAKETSSFLEAWSGRMDLK